jgi:hypothetical protein
MNLEKNFACIKKYKLGFGKMNSFRNSGKILYKHSFEIHSSSKVLKGNF